MNTNVICADGEAPFPHAMGFGPIGALDVMLFSKEAKGGGPSNMGHYGLAWEGQGDAARDWLVLSAGVLPPWAGRVPTVHGPWPMLPTRRQWGPGT